MAQGHVTDTDRGGADSERSGSGIRGLFRGRWRGGRGIWRRGIVLSGFAVLIALTMLAHARIPNRVGNLGSLLETFLPWLGLGIPVLLVARPAAPVGDRAGRAAPAGRGLAGPLRRTAHRQVGQRRRPHRRHPQRQRGEPRPGGHRRRSSPPRVPTWSPWRSCVAAGPRPTPGLAATYRYHTGAGHRRAVEQVPADRHRAGRHPAGLGARAAVHSHHAAREGRRLCRPSALGAGQVQRGLHRRAARRARRRAGQGHHRTRKCTTWSCSATSTAP